MSKHDLAAAYKAAQKQTHVKDFEVAGKTIRLPRLSFKRQAELELLVRKVSPDFSLSTVRNRAAVTMVSCVEDARRELVEKEGMPQVFTSKEEAAKWEDRLKVAILYHWGPLADTLFSAITREHMLYGVTLALQQQYGDQLETKDGNITIDEAFTEKLLTGDNGNQLETMFLWVTGVIGELEKAEEKIPKTMDELVEKELGGSPKGSKKQQEKSPTTTTTSPSSKQSTESTPGS